MYLWWIACKISASGTNLTLLGSFCGVRFLLSPGFLIRADITAQAAGNWRASISAYFQQLLIISLISNWIAGIWFGAWFKASCGSKGSCLNWALCHSYAVSIRLSPGCFLLQVFCHVPSVYVAEGQSNLQGGSLLPLLQLCRNQFFP